MKIKTGLDLTIYVDGRSNLSLSKGIGKPKPINIEESRAINLCFDAQLPYRGEYIKTLKHGIAEGWELA